MQARRDGEDRESRSAPARTPEGGSGSLVPLPLAFLAGFAGLNWLFWEGGNIPGKDNDAIVVIDPHADMVREVLTLVPPEIAHKVRLLDFGRMDRVPGINLVDPLLFPDRDRAVDTIISTVRNLWEHWGTRLEDILKNSLQATWEWNAHPDTPRDEMLTMLDILSLLEDGGEVDGRGRDARTKMSPFQSRVMRRVRDPRIKQWFQMYLGWPRDTRAEAVGPVHSRVGAYASNQRASVVMGQQESTINLSNVLEEGLVLLVSTAQGSIGQGPAALMGGTIVSLVDSALQDQENIEPSKRARCFLVCDEFQSVTGAPWESMFAESRKYGCSLMLATQSLVRLDTGERQLRAGVLGNVGVILSYQVSAEDARLISSEMDSTRVPERLLVNLNSHHCCVRINSDTTCYPSFTMRTLPPPDFTRSKEDAQRAVQAVLDSSLAYTVDFNEIRQRMDQEMQQRLEGGDKLGVLFTSGGDGADAGGSMYDRANTSGSRRPADNGTEVLGELGAASEESPVEDAGPPAMPETDGASPTVRDLVSRGVSPDDMERSQLSPEALTYIDEVGSRDPAVRALVEKNHARHISRAYKKANREADARVEHEVKEQLEERSEDLYHRAYLDALVTARSEVAEQLAEPTEDGSRDLSRRRRPSPEE